VVPGVTVQKDAVPPFA